MGRSEAPSRSAGVAASGQRLLLKVTAEATLPIVPGQASAPLGPLTSQQG